MWVEMILDNAPVTAPCGHPPCEDVSWNKYSALEEYAKEGHPPCEDVSWNAFLVARIGAALRHPPCEDVSWNDDVRTAAHALTVILLARMWVEISLTPPIRSVPPSHPPCEDVSWNVRVLQDSRTQFSHPPCEDVSWNEDDIIVEQLAAGSSSLRGCELKLLQNYRHYPSMCHPPCEDVSWNNVRNRSAVSSRASSSLRGCELKYYLCSRTSSRSNVILLARMWVEMHYIFCFVQSLGVILLARMWVEMFIVSSIAPASSSSSLRGCELKYS